MDPAPSGPKPATVETTPLSDTFRIAWFPKSATYKFPAGSTTIPLGWFNRASAAEPSSYPDCPTIPTKVVTCPPCTRRITWFEGSETYTTPPPASTATPLIPKTAAPTSSFSRSNPEKRGPIAGPFVTPVSTGTPQNVLTFRPASIATARIEKFRVSATKIRPTPPAAPGTNNKPPGFENFAIPPPGELPIPAPFANPGSVGRPAYVSTPFRPIRRMQWLFKSAT